MQRIAINKDNFHFRIKVKHIGEREFAGVVIESNRTDVNAYFIFVLLKILLSVTCY